MPSPGATEVLDLSGNGKGVNLSLSIQASGLSVEDIQDVIASTIRAGSNVVTSYDDFAGTLTINSTGGGTGTVINIDTTPLSLPAGSIGAPYSQQITAAGGTPPYQYFISAGTLPSGLTFPITGLLSGTPTAEFHGDITVLAVDVNGRTGFHNYTININISSTITAPILSWQGGIPGPTNLRVDLDQDTVAEGYFLHVQVDDTLTAPQSLGKLTNPIAEFDHQLDIGEMATGIIDFTKDNFTLPNGDLSVVCWVLTGAIPPVESPPSNILTGTINAATTILTSAVGADRASAITPSGSPQLTWTGATGRGVWEGIAANHAPYNTNYWFEHQPLVVTGGGFPNGFGIGNHSTFAFSSGFGNVPGLNNSNGVFFHIGTDGNVYAYWNAAANTQEPMANGPMNISTETLRVEHDQAGNTVKVFRVNKSTHVSVQLGTTINVTIANARVFAGSNNEQSGAFNFGQNTGAGTPTSGVLPHN
jgi:hypothetical protein